LQNPIRKINGLAQNSIGYRYTIPQNYPEISIRYRTKPTAADEAARSGQHRETFYSLHPGFGKQRAAAGRPQHRRMKHKNKAEHCAQPGYLILS
jgi:hypothetical protein